MIKLGTVIIIMIISTFTAFSYESPRIWVPKHYPNTRELHHLANELADKNPDVVSLVRYGSSVNGEKRGIKNLIALEIFDKNYIQKSVFLITAGIHPRELLTVYSAMNIAQWMVSEVANGNPYWTEYIKKVKIIIIPLINPDGYDMVMQGWNWRKSVSTHYKISTHRAPNSYGVDLNGNFDVNFRRLHPVASLEWGGPRPFSEPETRSLRNYLLKKKISASIALHSYGRYIAFPWWGNLTTRIRDHRLHETIGLKIKSLMKGYRLQKGCPYLVPGNFGDWIYANFKSFAYTIEIGDHFNPDKKTSVKWYNEILPGIKYLMDYVYKKEKTQPLEKNREEIEKIQKELFKTVEDNTLDITLNRFTRIKHPAYYNSGNTADNIPESDTKKRKRFVSNERFFGDENRFRLAIVSVSGRESWDELMNRLKMIAG